MAMVDIPASVITNPIHGRRRTIRAEVSPYDKSTVVSIFPKDNPVENKWTLTPGEFKIPYGTYENPGVLVVGPSSWWADINPDQPLVEVPVGSNQVANSIVVDFCNSYLGSDMGDSKPGIFWVPGAHDVASIKKNYQGELDKAKVKQRNLFEFLVKIADVDWARTNGNPLALSDLNRLAAKELGLDRPWLSNFKQMDMIRCVACGNMRNPNFPVCIHCKTVIDQAAYAKLNLKPAV